MPYLTLWDKISQNLAHLEANSHKIFKSHRIFRPILQHILWRNKHTSHFVVFITNFIHYNKGFWLFWGSFKVIFVKISQNFIKSHLKIWLISQISVTAYGMYASAAFFFFYAWITCLHIYKLKLYADGECKILHWSPIFRREYHSKLFFLNKKVKYQKQ